MQESRSGIDRLDALPVLAGHVHHQLVDDDAGIVDQDVESAEALDRQAPPLRGPVFGDVGLKRHQPRSSEFLDRRVDVFGNDLGTSSCSSKAIALPIPLAAPVTSATLPATSAMTLCFESLMLIPPVYMTPWAPWLSTGSVLLIVAPRTFAGLLWLSDSCAQKPDPDICGPQDRTMVG